jgi:hypothetical protein
MRPALGTTACVFDRHILLDPPKVNVIALQDTQSGLPQDYIPPFSAPTIFPATQWHDSTAMAKGVRFREHIEWAASHGSPDKVRQFFATLPEGQWFHLGD